ncbi:phosphatidate cytidylyltransferase [Candidatus Neptunochlamydia vexilliferae]|uniref:Phosphatidate cytidylyltransferase n=1 Tax=Candidatus Neptunichlamydia vexilliferae TaxID=1651774 RepID=A0ABS0AWU2_9BACT|nr:phosphatidate cytidylyltransferase [Candidatus Neptunochlamydia vexilliferae]MBF5058598.1 hypothetical protein [Candidatus Neptunochlamydia vexilliferae]
MLKMSMFPLLTPPIIWAFIGILSLLLAFQVFVWVRGKTERFKDLQPRLTAWWYILGIFLIAFLTRQWCFILLWMGVSFLALREFFNAIPTDEEHKQVRLWLYLSIPVQYAFILIDYYSLFLIFIPVYVYLLFPVRMIIVGKTEHFLQSMGSYFWGIMMAGYSLSYVAYLAPFSSRMGFKAGPLGLMIFLLVLTELNDAAQYMWGKLFGKHKVVPKISPKKSVEGLVGGIITTSLLAMVFAPFLTPLTLPWAALVGFLIGIGGFFGDVTMSALKRDMHVKDFGTLLPGHGGLLDRVDSLVFTAPLFFHLLYWKLG